jgi:hypothetical protein
MFTPTLTLRVVSIADPTALVLDGAPHTYSLAPERGPLRLHFDLAADQRLLFDAFYVARLCPSGVDCTARYQFIDPSGTPTTTSALAWPSNIRIRGPLSISTVGRWTLELQDAVRADFTISVLPVRDIVVTQVPANTGLTAFAGGQHDERLVVKVPGVAGHCYTFSTAGFAFLVNPPSVEIIDPTGALVSIGSYVHDATMDGVFQVVITPPLGTALSAFDYTVADTTTLRVNVALGVSSPVVTPVLDQRVEFTFAGTAGQKIATKAATFAYPLFPQVPTANVVFLRPDGTQLGATRVISSTTTFLDPLRLDATGTWTVRVTSRCPLNGSCNLQMRFTSVPDVTGSLVVDSTVLPFTISKPGQVARFTFTRSAGQTFRVHFTLSSFRGASVSLTPPLGTPALLCTLNNGALDCPLRTATTSGTYSIVVNPPLEQVGAAAIAVTRS